MFLKLKLISFLFSVFCCCSLLHSQPICLVSCVACNVRLWCCFLFVLLFALFASRQSTGFCVWNILPNLFSQPKFLPSPILASFPILFFIIYSYFPVMFRIEYNFLSFYWATCIQRAFWMRLPFTDWMSVLKSVHFVRLEAFTQTKMFQMFFFLSSFSLFDLLPKHTTDSECFFVKYMHIFNESFNVMQQFIISPERTKLTNENEKNRCHYVW